MTTTWSVVVSAAIAIGLIAGSGTYLIERQLKTLDKAQAAFEANTETSRGYNWPWYHEKKAGMSIHCTDVADDTLRYCTMVLPFVNPQTLEPAGVSFESFACSTTACAWDPTGAAEVNP